MHEFSLLADLLRKIEDVSRQHNGARVVGVEVRIGALAHISGDHFREHFEHAVAGGPLEAAQLRVTESTDQTEAHAQDILLVSVEVEE